MEHLSHSVMIYQTIRERIIAVEADIDERTLTDTLEGITDLQDVIAAVVRSALLEEALAQGLKGHIQVLQERLERLSERCEERRQIARDAMLDTGLKKIAAPDFTVSIRPGSPALVIVEEGGIPSQYWEPREPRLDRRGILDDLKKGLSVDGAQLSNPEPVLAVRVK